MEIAYLSEESAKIRGKQVSLLINPASLSTKTSADVAVFFHRLNTKPKNLETRLIIEGSGDYEIGGVKITGATIGEVVCYSITIDGVDLFVAKTSSLSKAKDAVREYEIALLQSDNLMEQSVMTALNPNVFIFWGEKAEDNVKALGKEDGTKMSKYVVTKEKLPKETQIVLLQ